MLYTNSIGKEHLSVTTLLYNIYLLESIKSGGYAQGRHARLTALFSCLARRRAPYRPVLYFSDMNTEHNNGPAGTDAALDFVAIGDIVVDAFIRLNEESRAHVIEKENGDKEIALPFGDKIQFEFAEEIVAVGNSANAAVSAARLGLSTGIVVNLGKDHDGEKSLAQLKKENVSTAFVRSHEGKKTNYHYVLWYKDERTILIKHELFDYKLPDIGNPKCVYLSSVSENALPFHDAIADYLEGHPDVKLVFQPGTFQMKWGTHAMQRIYRRADLLFCNVEEAERILDIKSELVQKDHHDAAADPSHPKHAASFIKSLLDGLRALGPQVPVITDGPNGAYAYGSTEDGSMDYHQVVQLSIYPDIAPPYERTGAGDSFASAFSSAYLLGNSIETSLKWGAINAMNVCQHVGAQKGLLTKADIESYLAKAPEGWGAKPIL